MDSPGRRQCAPYSHSIRLFDRSRYYHGPRYVAFAEVDVIAADGRHSFQWAARVTSESDAR